MALEEGTPGYPRLDPDQLYTAAEAAVALRIEPPTLRNWRNCKQGPRGPKFRQYHKNGPVQYLGQWLIDFRDAAIVETEDA